MAKRRLAPISSATSSTLERVSPVLGLPAALLQVASDHDPRALGQAQRHVLGQVTPADDVEERGGLLPLLGLAVLPPAIDRDCQRVVAWPSLVYLISGSRVRLPVMVVVVMVMVCFSS